MLRLILAVVVLAHGVGHLLFLGPSLRIADWAGQTSHSWLLTDTIGDGPSRAIASAIWIAAVVLFVAGVGAFLLDTAWWREITIVGALVSITGIVLFWDGLATSSAAFALAFDVALLVSLLVAHWPAPATVGA